MVLNHHSGLLGIAGLPGVREVQRAAAGGDAHARLALDVLQAESPNAVARDLDHRRRDVREDHAPSRRHGARGGEADSAGTRAELENRLTRLRRGGAQQPLRDGRALLVDQVGMWNALPSRPSAR